MLKVSRREIPALVWRIETQLTENSLSAKGHLHSNNAANKEVFVNEECGEGDEVQQRKVVKSSISCSIIQR